MSDWCILRCSPARTLRLFQSLSLAGYDAWTPVGPVVIRDGIFRTRKEIQTALMPTFVFARADRRLELLALSRSPSLLYQVWDAELRKMVTKGHPPFSLFKSGEHRPIPDSDLAHLRRAEQRNKNINAQLTSVQPFKVGEMVMTDDGGFQGLVGKVVSVSGKWVDVEFPRWPAVPRFGAWLLRPLDDVALINVRGAQPEQAMPAKAA